MTGGPVPASIDFRPFAEGGRSSYAIEFDLQDDNNMLEPNRTFFVELTWNANCSTSQSMASSVHCDCGQLTRVFLECGCDIVLENAIVTIQDDDGRSLPM